MLDAKVAQLLNEQVNKEFYSAYLYLDFSIYYEEEGLDGFANWYKIRTMQFLDWFVKEQGEEEKNAEDLIKKMKLYGEDAKGLYMLNSEMAARVYTAPSLVL